MIIRINGQKTRITITDTEGCTISLRDNITIRPFSGSLKKGDPLHVACMEHLLGDYQYLSLEIVIDILLTGFVIHKQQLLMLLQECLLKA